VKKLPTNKSKINLFTIGFTQKTAQDFFNFLLKYKVTKIIDIRLNNTSQLSGFAKKKDLIYFLKTIANIDYEHNLNLAPTQDILKDYQKNKNDWSIYEKQFLELIKKRKIETKLAPESLDNSCLLCSEPTPLHCHRRLVAEYLQHYWQNINIIHL
jgi:uncharacterized protein (DUF488 family)